MAKIDISTKRLAITQANAQMVIVTAVASFVTVFCLIAAHSLWQLKSYQGRVISTKETANRQLQTNVKNLDNLRSAYDSFSKAPLNVLSGNRDGKGDNDGDNAKIVLDALPSKYDFPALTSSLEKILKERNYSISSITGTDDELAQQAAESQTAPAAVAMPFGFTIGNSSYVSAQDLVSTLERSIRPMPIDSLHLSGGATSMQITITAHTYYQPGKDLKITTKEIR